MKKMKKIILLSILSLLIFSNCKNEPKKEKVQMKEIAEVPSQNFNWLVGEWVRKNEKKGKETFEIWKKNSVSEYFGHGYTVKEKDTVQQEFIKLYYKDKKWNLEVELKGDPDIVTFKMTSYSSSAFICENKNHDFPKLIKYERNGDKLNALVKGDDFQIPFAFEKVTEK